MTMILVLQLASLAMAAVVLACLAYTFGLRAQQEDRDEVLNLLAEALQRYQVLSNAVADRSLPLARHTFGWDTDRGPFTGPAYLNDVATKDTLPSDVRPASAEWLWKRWYSTKPGDFMRVSPEELTTTERAVIDNILKDPRALLLEPRGDFIDIMRVETTGQQVSDPRTHSSGSRGPWAPR